MGSDGYLDFQDDESKFAAVASKLGEAAKKGLAVAEAAIANVTSKLGEGITAGLQYNASVESYQTSFEIMTGSAGKAAEVMERLKKAGAETPLELPDLVDTTQLLMRYGLTADVFRGRSPIRRHPADDRGGLQSFAGDIRKYRGIYGFSV